MIVFAPFKIFFYFFKGNGLVIYISIAYRKLNDITNFYIFNLAITDLLFILFCIPFTTYLYMYDDWLLGVAFCKMNHFFSHVSLYFNYYYINLKHTGSRLFYNKKKYSRKCVHANGISSLENLIILRIKRVFQMNCVKIF